MATASAIIAVIGLALSEEEKAAQAREQKKQKVASRATEFEKRARERRQQIRERRIKTAQLQTSAETTGVTGSSGQLGAESVFSTNFAVNTGFGNQLQASRNVIDASSVRIAKSQQRQATAQSIFSTASGIANSDIFE